MLDIIKVIDKNHNVLFNILKRKNTCMAEMASYPSIFVLPLSEYRTVTEIYLKTYITSLKHFLNEI